MKIVTLRELSAKELEAVSGGTNPTNGPYYPPGTGVPGSSGAPKHPPLQA